MCVLHSLINQPTYTAVSTYTRTLIVGAVIIVIAIGVVFVVATCSEHYIVRGTGEVASAGEKGAHIM